MADLNRILISGGGGIIGSNLDFGFKPSKEEFDVTNPDCIRKVCDKYNPSGTLGLSNVDLKSCEANPLLAYKVNVFGVYNLAKECRRRRIPFILISSGAVFSGNSMSLFNEDSPPEPLNIYAQTKYLAEILALEISEKNLILRTGWVFGAGNNSNRINLLDKMISLTAEGKKVRASNDQYGSPTYVKDLVGELKRIISESSSGIYHIVNSERASATDFIVEAKNILKSSSEIEQVSAKEFSSGIVRSQSECLISKKINLRSWRESLREYLKNNRDLNPL